MLGGLFRRRGEVDRAIRIHQNLIARPQLDARYKTQALAEKFLTGKLVVHVLYVLFILFILFWDWNVKIS